VLRPHNVLRFDQMSSLLECFYSAEQQGWVIKCDPISGHPTLSWTGARPKASVGGFLLPRVSQLPLLPGASPFVFHKDKRWTPLPGYRVKMPDLGVLLGPVALAAASCKS